MSGLGYIYRLYSAQSNTAYVGQTRRHPQRRWNELKCHARTKPQLDTPLFRQIRQEGPAAFVLEILDVVPISELDEAEQRHISTQTASSLNIEAGSYTKGKAPLATSTRHKLHKKALGRKHTAETRAFLAAKKRKVGNPIIAWNSTSSMAFCSRVDAIRAGYNSGSLSRLLKAKDVTRTHRGFHWAYLDTFRCLKCSHEAATDGAERLDE